MKLDQVSIETQMDENNKGNNAEWLTMITIY